MFCPGCGSEIRDDSRFCFKCGVSLAGGPVRPVMPQQNSPIQPGQQMVQPGSPILPIPQNPYRNPVYPGSQPMQGRQVYPGSQPMQGRPVYPGSQPVQGRPVYPGYQGMPVQSMPPRKRNHIGLKIFGIALAVMVAAVFLSFVSYIDDYSGVPEPDWVGVTPPDRVVRGPGELTDYLNDYQIVKFDTVSAYFNGHGGDSVNFDTELDKETVFNNLCSDEYLYPFIHSDPYICPDFCYFDVRATLGSKPGLKIYELRDCRLDQEEVRAAARQVASSLEGTTSQKVLQIHDYLCDRNVYNLDSDMTHSAYNALLDGNTCCEGYALAFVAICNEAGINAYKVSGLAWDEYDPSDIGGHAWNIVQLEDGNWYELDITWDDTCGNYRYFCIPTSVMARDHRRDDDYMRGYANVIPVTYEPYADDSGSFGGSMKAIAQAPGAMIGRIMRPDLPIGDVAPDTDQSTELISD